jgi:hypothetical protein
VGAGDAAPNRRRIGRILSLGFPLPGVRVDNYNFISAPSFFDYDALVVDIAALASLIDGVLDGSVEATTFADRPVRAEADAAGAIALADVLARRSVETEQLLANDGVIVLFAHPPRTRARSGASIGDLDWLGDVAPSLDAAEGTQIEVVDHQHAVAHFLAGQQANISYRSSVANAARVIARSYGGAVIAAEIATKRGRVVLLPALKALPGGEGRYAMSDALQGGIRRLLGAVGEGREPRWAAEYAARLPSVDEDDRARWLQLLWQQGQLGLEDVIFDALKLIGLDVYANNPEALELRAGGKSILLEVDASDGAVGLAAHYRLRQRIERAAERGGTTPRGLIVINGYRFEPPHERPMQASPALRALAETMTYAVIPTMLLFDAVAARLAGDESAVAAFRERLTREHGVLG